MIYFIIAWLLGLTIGWLVANILRKTALATLANTITNLERDLGESKHQSLLFQEKHLQISKELATSVAHHIHLEKKIAEQGESFNLLQTQLSIHFKNLANDLLEEKSKKFTDQSQLQMERLLTPLNEKITTFEKQVTHYNQESLARNVALRTELKQLHELNIKITKEAENLTKALKGDAKLQGGWGEFILENILTQSGLVKNREYVIQPSITTENGQRLQPDVVINLPEGRNIIIDSKVSLNHYEQFFNMDNEMQRSFHLKQHIHSIRRHIKTLNEKSYQSLYGLQHLDFVLMFIPIEPAFVLAVQEAATLFNEAYERNIVIVSPSNLMATLRTIANLWRQAYQNQNAVEIATQGGALYDKFVSFIEDIKNIGRQLDLTKKNYLEATKKLYDGKGSLVSRAQKMKILGARTSKVLDQQLIDKAINNENEKEKEE
ncbi:DNA recombination protein RmuC [Candidatus Cardinium hertigii]|jgi:DNA recombination protein RmuC|uniref:DNA recombination protein RmuC n=1 Tax=Candidatus Cardinium hertigii TaxID=247481 RepID=A0A3N2QCI5_9BACT|nr:DNA recombination protein RmuC [Candidatus Cardinium hertigii]ROT47399.1 DNA recombination protein RmuC [Candidatus Cardinium hertigii]